MPPDLRAIAERFAIEGVWIDAQPHAGGHINASYRVQTNDAGRTHSYLLQRINDHVFRDPERVVANIANVTAHIRRRLKNAGVTNIDRRVLTLVPTRDGSAFTRDVDGGCWRMLRFIESARVRQSVRTADEAYAAARAIGDFQRQLADYDGPPLSETIPNFHDTPLRFEVLHAAIVSDSHDRVREAQPEIEAALARESFAGILIDLHKSGEIPERIVHNDAKASNVLLDAATGEPLCVVDLDTVMPGLSLYDLGDMVRSMSTTAAEDEPDLSRVEVEPPLYEGLARGYLESAGEFLNDAERAHLLDAGKLITLEQAVRFLTDHLAGDAYYRTSRPGHNLDRCRTQLKLLESLERNEDRLRGALP